VDLVHLGRLGDLAGLEPLDIFSLRFGEGAKIDAGAESTS